MPFNTIHVPATLPPATCRAINHQLHAALVEACAVNPDDDFCLIIRHAPEDMILHPTFLGTRDPDGTIILQVTLLAGRSDEQKEEFYKNIRQRLREIGFEPRNSIVFLVENRAIDWSFSETGSVKTVLGL
ncbi:MAG: tautomerase family protein [Methylobacterium sp.]|jgi:hypothetical protein|nr:tautomerase family protein [Methylobacterium sp.]MCA3605051.1 tautomerase family protein [Methylobacterium sp.]MCA3609784.1 tautomerase family protein [Methylobacterium sp.]MCA3611555.1 tautomerase family protein [Methylobacterium sp.]MCA3617018.1 tautomerase family protein [Methylobacterium sp.]